MEVNRGYVDSGIMTANEVRAKLGLPDHEDGNTLKNRQPTAQDVMSQFDQVKETIKTQVEKMYKKD